MKITEYALPILALVVSAGSATFSYVQSRTSAAQLRLVEQQLRPHVSYIPTFFRTKKGLDVDMYLQNQSALPANVIYTDVAAWIGGEFVSPNFHSISPDIIYQEKGGLSSLPTLSGKPLSRIDHGDEFALATCAIYASTAKSDSRRWMLLAIHEYIPGSSLPKRVFIEEQEVASSESSCSARDVRALHERAIAGASYKAMAPSK